MQLARAASYNPNPFLGLGDKITIYRVSLISTSLGKHGAGRNCMLGDDLRDVGGRGSNASRVYDSGGGRLDDCLESIGRAAPIVEKFQPWCLPVPTVTYLQI